MHFKALVSAIALGTAVSIAAPAAAQGLMIPEDEMALVEARCMELAETEENSSLVDSETAENDESDEEVSATAESSTLINLELLDLQTCVDSGLVEEVP